MSNPTGFTGGGTSGYFDNQGNISSHFSFGNNYFVPFEGGVLGALNSVLPLAIPILVAVIIVNFGTRWFRGTIGG